ncbi:hypothetical protein [Roseateles sp. P5_D6]
MKKALGSFAALVVALGLLAGLGFGAWLSLDYLASLYAGWDFATRSLAIGIAAGLVGAGWIAHAIRQAGRDRLAVPHREARAVTYRLFAECWSLHLQQLGAPSQALREAQVSLEAMLALSGSRALIEAHATLRELSAQPGARAEALWPVLADAFKAARAELGAEAVEGEWLDALLSPAAPEPAAPTAAPELSVA